jgi:hypothetical protein
MAEKLAVVFFWINASQVYGVKIFKLALLS